MARRPRLFLPGQPHHVIQRGNNRSHMFATEDDFYFFQTCFVEAASAAGVAVHAYSWMPNHVHALATPEKTESISTMMQAVGRRYVQHFNRTRWRTGTLWEGRFRATLIDSDRYFFTCSRYIEWNALRAGLVTRPEDYQWSSYGANALGRPDELITPHPLYLSLAKDGKGRQAAYRRLFDHPLREEELADIRHATNRAWVLGTTAFKAHVESLAGRRVSPLAVRRGRRGPRGRPANEGLTPYSEGSDPTSGGV